MILEGEVTVLDPFTHTKQDKEKIDDFDFIRESSAREKLMIDQTFCTLVAVGGKFVENKTFKKVLEKIDEIRKIFRIYIFCFFIT